MGTSDNSAFGVDRRAISASGVQDSATIPWKGRLRRPSAARVINGLAEIIQTASRHRLAMIACVAALLYLSALGSAPLWDRDEPRNARCAEEMLDRGDWVVPYFNGEIRTHKPVLLYWLMMLVTSVVGRNEWGARLPSALLSIATICLTYRFGCRTLGTRAGVWGGTILATSLLFTMASRAATPDATLVFCTTLGLTMFAELLGVTSYRPKSGTERTSGVAWYLGMTALGLGALAKGPIGILLPLAVIVFYVLTSLWGDETSRNFDERKKHLMSAIPSFRRLLMGGVLAAGICLPWYVWVSVRTDGEWIRAFLSEHNVSRALHSMEGHDGGIVYYPLTLMVGFFPWSVLTIPIGIDLWRSRRIERQSISFLASWLATVVLGFTLAQTKLPSYILPAYPAVALLLGWHIDRWLRGTSCTPQIWYTVGFATMATVGLALLIGIPMALPNSVRYAIPMAFAGLFPLLFGVVAIVGMRTISARLAPYLLVLSAVGINLSIFAGSTSVVGSVQQIRALLAKIPAPGMVARASYGHLEPTWVYYGDQPIREISAEDLTAVSMFFDSHPGGILLVAEPNLRPIQSQIGDYEVVAAVEEFLKPRKLLAVRRNPQTHATPVQ
jgi:4-amino-4-deoxy-L-arabinose transferase-like glycosyltransferase